MASANVHQFHVSSTTRLGPVAISRNGSLELNNDIEDLEGIFLFFFLTNDRGGFVSKNEDNARGKMREYQIETHWRLVNR